MTRKKTCVSTIALLLLACVSAARALNPIVVKGYKLFDSVTGEEFVVKGVDYYPRTNAGPYNVNSYDYFSNKNKAIWERDIPYLKGLGVNAVRLYSVDPEQKHNLFMDALDKAGIYALVSLVAACPICAVTRQQAPDCYPPHLKERGQAVINEFAFYDNTLAISAGNEVNLYAPITQPQWNAPCQKKFLRDMRQYIAGCPGLRQVPIGLASADSFRPVLAAYYNCQGDPHDPYEVAEWYGINTYVFCNGKVDTYDQALGFIALKQSFASYNYSLPVMLTEYGCLSPTFPTVDGYAGTRSFAQTRWLIDQPAVRDQFVGGFVFEYSTESTYAASQSPYPFKSFGFQDYGVGYFSPSNCDDIKIPCKYNPVPAYHNLANAINVSSPNGTKLNVMMKDFVPSKYRTGRSACPSWFPPLTNFTWKTDKIPFGKCPAGTGPGSSGKSAGTSTSTGTGSTSKTAAASSTIAIFPIVVLVVVAIIIVALVLFFCLKREEKVGTTTEKAELLNGEANGEVNGEDNA